MPTAGIPAGRGKVREALHRFAFGLFWLFALGTVAVVVFSVTLFEQSFYDNGFFWVFFGFAAIFGFMARRVLSVGLVGLGIALIVWDWVRPSYDEMLIRGAWHFVLWLALGVAAAIFGYCMLGAIGKRLNDNDPYVID